MVQSDASFKIKEIIGVELDDSFATSDDGKEIWNHRPMYVKSKELKVKFICHYSQLCFIIDNRLGRYEHFNSYNVHTQISDNTQTTIEEIA